MENVSRLFLKKKRKKNMNRLTSTTQFKVEFLLRFTSRRKVLWKMPGLLLMIIGKGNVIFVRLRFHWETWALCKKGKEWKEICFFLQRQTVSKSNEKEKDVEQVQNVTPKTAAIMEAQTGSLLKHFLVRETSMPRFCGI